MTPAGQGCCWSCVEGLFITFRALATSGYGLEDLLLLKAALVLSQLDSELQGIASPAVPHIGCNRGPS
jgi:hypothetical protein